MSENILEKIIKKKIEKIDHLKKSINLNQLNDLINVNIAQSMLSPTISYNKNIHSVNNFLTNDLKPN